MVTFKKPKSQSVTNEQKQAIIYYLGSHPEFTKGKFTNSFTHSIASKQWNKLGETLNAMTGFSKECKIWRKVMLFIKFA